MIKKEEVLKLVSELWEKVDNLEELLRRVLKEEELLKNNVLVKKGFIIKRCSINLRELNIGVLKSLKEGLDRVKNMESSIMNVIKENERCFKLVEIDYNSYNSYKQKKRQRIRFVNIFKEYVNNMFYFSGLAIVRIDELISLDVKFSEVHKKDKETYNLIKSLERMLNQIVRSVNLIKQFKNKIFDFVENRYYSEERYYGRCMGKKEYKLTKKKGVLIGVGKKVGDLIAVFDAYRSVRSNIRRMSKDKIKNFFGIIGVKGYYCVLFFKTNIKPVNEKGVCQSNGLIEYKFPYGTRIEICEEI